MKIVVQSNNGKKGLEGCRVKTTPAVFLVVDELKNAIICYRIMNTAGEKYGYTKVL